MTANARPKKLYAAKTWHARWMYTARGGVLHRMAHGKTPKGYEPECALDGETVCSLRGRFFMPGFLSRLGRQRCTRCCRALDIPYGNGAPMNVGGPKWKNA